MTTSTYVILGFIVFFGALVLISLDSNNRSPNRKISVPSRPRPLLNINDEAKKIALQIEIKDLTLEFYKSDDPYITFYRSTGMIEVETNKRSFAFSLNSILFMKYDPDECGIYYE